MKLIWHILAIAITIDMGPSNESVKPNIKELSIKLRSFENLFVRIPDGVVSKKLGGARSIASTMS